MHVILDVSRFLTLPWRTAPSGIDRVEMAYVERWLGVSPAAVTFCTRGPFGPYALVPPRLVAELARLIATLWQGGESAATLALIQRRARRLARWAQARAALGRGRKQLAEVLRRHRPAIFLLVSHRLMEHPGPIAALRAAGAAFVPLVHDLIPATHPEYARPGVAGQHLLRLDTVAALADGVIVNSQATAEVLRPHLVSPRGQPPLLVAPLGITLTAAISERAATIGRHPWPADPYFVCIGTIEPRKNHLLLLHLWRDFATRWGPAAPRLVLIGRRGWENENIIDLLERCALLRGVVIEMGALPDSAVTLLLKGARALLFPSFAEGYGLPVAEALACGTPVICSDLPALREVGNDVPDYLDPLDGLGWRRLILDYADPASHSRAQQLARLAAWQAPSWPAHFAAVDELLTTVIARWRAEKKGEEMEEEERATALPPDGSVAPAGRAIGGSLSAASR